ncbi:hypothetical protein DFH05DRAFT_1489312 [Lentinula detonsa]|uniref:Uncharacterized protein n=1 Tax=Lentinula detonsa TaxID=2804962 RepID=A0A9W8TZ09_9AGAR|nr:hypothetical protein DFH05DRAFT_1489312 [Lentinula detonsa]
MSSFSSLNATSAHLHFNQYQPYIDGITMPIPGFDNHVYPIGHESKGQALYFEYGQWRAQTIRAELHELQHANMGRKSAFSSIVSVLTLYLLRYAEVDRRSLDPPPVVALRLYQLVQTGPYNFQEIEIINYE